MQEQLFNPSKWIKVSPFAEVGDSPNGLNGRDHPSTCRPDGRQTRDYNQTEDGSRKSEVHNFIAISSKRNEFSYQNVITNSTRDTHPTWRTTQNHSARWERMAGRDIRSPSSASCWLAMPKTAVTQVHTSSSLHMQILFKTQNDWTDNGLGMRVVGGLELPGSHPPEIGAFVTEILPGGVVDTHGQVEEGDEVLEWNGIELRGRSFEEVQSIISSTRGEVEIVIGGSVYANFQQLLSLERVWTESRDSTVQSNGGKFEFHFFKKNPKRSKKGIRPAGANRHHPADNSDLDLNGNSHQRPQPSSAASSTDGDNRPRTTPPSGKGKIKFGGPRIPVANSQCPTSDDRELRKRKVCHTLVFFQVLI